jgi:prevent-host-death family protein
VSITVGAYEAKTHLPGLLARVERGERVTITRHGRPIAQLIPAEPTSPIATVLEEMQAMLAALQASGRSGAGARARR